MFNKKLKNQLTSMQKTLDNSLSVIDSIKTHVAVIEFTPDGIIVDVNDLFLAIAGYSREEAIGQHHRVMCHHELTQKIEYTDFWNNLKSGDSMTGTFERVNKSGNTIWLEATYIPISCNNQITKIIKIASDITAKKNEALAQEAIIRALHNSQAIIETLPWSPTYAHKVEHRTIMRTSSCFLTSNVRSQNNAICITLLQSDVIEARMALIFEKKSVLKVNIFRIHQALWGGGGSRV